MSKYLTTPQFTLACFKKCIKVQIKPPLLHVELHIMQNTASSSDLIMLKTKNAAKLPHWNL